MARMRERHATLHSQVDSSLTFDQSRWVVSIVRKPVESGERVNPEHAFLILEGANERNELVVRRYDLFINEAREGYSLIKYNEVTAGTPSDIQAEFNKLIWKATAAPLAKLYYKSWNIIPSQVLALHQDIKNDEKNPPKYNISGNENITGASTTTGSLARGHSCFTWAREKLRNLKDPRIDSGLESDWRDYFIAIPSIHLRPPGKGGCCVVM
jgi:hypothetical protein